MSEVRLHLQASAGTLAVARIVVCLVWLSRLLRDPIHQLGYLPAELWHAYGAMRLLPDSFVAVLIDPVSLSVLRAVAIGLAVLVILGTRPQRLTLAAFFAVLIVYLGVSRGFGGHVNHRELVLLYVTGLLFFLPIFDACALHEGQLRDAAVYRSSMIAICLLIAVSYLFVGLARATMGFPVVFDPEVMRGWLVGRSLRPNPLGIEFGAAFLDGPASNYLIPLMLPVSTLMEILAPAALWLRRRYRIALLIGLGSMHLGIALLMNIVFIENILLLALFVDYTPWMERLSQRRRSSSPPPYAVNTPNSAIIPRMIAAATRSGPANSPRSIGASYFRCMKNPTTSRNFAADRVSRSGTSSGRSASM